MNVQAHRKTETLFHDPISLPLGSPRHFQAAVAGLLSTTYGRQNVEVGIVNDPDRNLPLDINVFSAGPERSILFSVEVKDKKVSGSDILSSVEKVIPFQVSSIVYVALHNSQDEDNFAIETELARDRGCRIVIYYSWESLVSACLMGADSSGPSALSDAYLEIGRRLIELQVSERGVDLWASFQHP